MEIAMDMKDIPLKDSPEDVYCPKGTAPCKVMRIDGAVGYVAVQTDAPVLYLESKKPKPKKPKPKKPKAY